MKFKQLTKIAAVGSVGATFSLLASCNDAAAEEPSIKDPVVKEAPAVKPKQEKVEFTFEAKTKKVLTKPETKIIFVEYPFQNNTQETIEIIEYDAPCTCMGARLRRPDGKQSLIFKPGEKGVVIGKLDFGNFTGSIDKKIWIRTSKDPKGEPSIILTASVTIPTLIGPDKAGLNWVEGGELTPQVFNIKVNHTKPIKIIRHAMGFGADEFFAYKIETIKEGQEYKVTVTPKKTNAPSLGVLRFYTDHELQRYKMVQVFLTINKKK